MTNYTKTLMLAGVAALSLTACGGDGKGPGALGTKNDIVVRNNGLPGAQKQAEVDPNSPITSTVEQVEGLPPATVAAGEPVPAPEGMAAAEPLPSTDPAVDAAAQKVAEAKAPVPSTTTTPVTDGTTASTAPVTDTVQSDVVAPEKIADQGVTPPQLEGTASAEEKSAGEPVYPKTTSAPAPQTTPAVAPTQPAAAVEQSAATTGSASTVVAKPSGTHDTAYSIPAPAGSAAATTPTESAASVTSASGAINPYSPALIKAAQSALATKAAYTGAANGELSSEFLNALSKYQSTNGLAPGGVTTETLRHLSVIE